MLPGDVSGRGDVPGEWIGRGERCDVAGEGGGRPDVLRKDSPARFLAKDDILRMHCEKIHNLKV